MTHFACLRVWNDEHQCWDVVCYFTSIVAAVTYAIKHRMDDNYKWEVILTMC